MKVLSDDTFTVLVIDDYPLMCQLIKDSLVKLSSVACIMKNDLPSAKYFLKQHPVDLAIIDLNLGEFSGLEIIKYIRSGMTACSYNIPLLIVSGNTYKKRIKDCVNFDVQEIIAKPVQPATMQERVRKYVNFPPSIKPCSHYADIQLPDDIIIRKAVSASTSRDTEATTVYVKKAGVKTEEELLPAYKPVLSWPDATTGKHQLDSRLNKLCYSFNMLIYLSSEKKPTESIVSLLKTINETIDNILFLSKKLATKEPNNEAWPALISRLKEFRALPIKRVADKRATAKTIADVAASAKTIWLKLIRKPVFFRKSTE